jgi:hypothetical protein
MVVLHLYGVLKVRRVRLKRGANQRGGAERQRRHGHLRKRKERRKGIMKSECFIPKERQVMIDRSERD